MKRILLLIAAMAFLSIQAYCQWSADPLQNTPVGVYDGDQIITKISTHPSGITYVAYFSLESGNYNVRLQKIDVFGNKQWGAGGLLLSDHTSESWITDFDMKVDKDTCAVVVFQDIRSGSNEVYAYRISPDGTFLWGADGIRLTTNADADYSPVVAPTDAGNSIFAWQNSGTTQKIGMQKLDHEGVKQWGDGILLAGTGQNYKFPRLLPAPGDQVYVMWFKQGPGMYDPKYLNAQKISPTGTSAWLSDLAVASAGGFSVVPDIAYINDPAGGLFVCWYDDRNNDWNYSTFVQHIDSEGNALWTADGIEAIVNNANNHMYPGISVTDDGNDLYVFVEEMDANQDNQGIFGQRLNVTGTQMWETTGKVFLPIASSEVGMLQAHTAGKNCVLFYLNGPAFGNAVLKAMKVDQEGAYVWPVLGGQIDVSSAASAKTDLATSMFCNGQWVATWSDARSDGGDIYGQNLKPDGTFGPLPTTLNLSADSLVFMTYDECFTGKPLVVRNQTPLAAVISSFDEYFAWPGAMWYIENPPIAPVTILPGDSLTLLVKVTFPVREFTDFRVDTLDINTNFGAYSAKILLNSILYFEIKDASATSARAFPNPFTSVVNIQGSLPGEETAMIEIRDISGRLLKQERLDISNSGNYSFRWGDSHISDGIYFCKISGANSISKSILLVKK